MSDSNKMRVPEAARYLGFAESTLNKMRCFGGGPLFAKAGPRIVIYDRLDLDAWLESRTFQSTSEFQKRKPAAK